MMKTIATLFLLALTLAMPDASRAEHEGKVQIQLLGDSTTEASIPRMLAPKEAQLEDVIRVLLAGYRVIADETAKFLATIIRERSLRADAL